MNDDAKYARKMTMKHTHQLFVVDLELTPSFEAPTTIRDWIQTYGIDVLYVIGAFTYEYHNIDRHMTIIVEGATLLDVMDAPQGSRMMDYTKEMYLKKLPVLPKTVDEAVDQIISDMTLEEICMLRLTRRGLETGLPNTAPAFDPTSGGLGLATVPGYPVFSF